jgi:hypothetical protein
VALTRALFLALAKIGEELIAIHALKTSSKALRSVEYRGNRNPAVARVSFRDGVIWLDEVETNGFHGVTERIWRFDVGGYQVCEKWLKDRRGRTLTKADIAHYTKIVVALAETIRLMQEADEVIDKHGGWPGAFATRASAS